MQFWSAYRDMHKNQTVLVIKHGSIDLELITSYKNCDYNKFLDSVVAVEEIIPIIGKNIGRSNETTSTEQCDLEIKSRYEEKYKKGFTLDLDTALKSKYKVNSLGHFAPMLAKDTFYTKEISWPNYVQPKLNGHRCIAYLGAKDEKPFMYSRRGIKIETMPHILQQLEYIKKSLNLHEMYFDGELYCHKESLQKQTSWIKKHQEDSIKISYNIYDIFSQQILDKSYAFGDRLNLLLVLNNKKAFKNNLYLVDTRSINSKDDIDYYKDLFIKQGYEGAMFRNNKGLYEPGERSKDLIKFKESQDSEWKVIDIIEGNKRIQNNTNKTSVILICETKSKNSKNNSSRKEFEVTAPGTIKEKQDILKNKKDYINKKITVKHFGYTKDGIPFHPVALQWKNDL